MFTIRKGTRDLTCVGGFRHRGKEVTRLEGFADAVFGFALTLLVVSLDVPKTVDDLIDAFRGFPSFAFCFLMLALIWNGHYKYCRRFGLDDGWSRFLTCIMLFLVLFFVYPLKFLFSIGVNSLLFPNPAHSIIVTRAKFTLIQVSYALGFAAVYLVLVLLYLHAYRLREILDLNEREKAETRYQIWRLCVLVGMGILAAILAELPSIWRWSAFVYALLFPIMSTMRRVHVRRMALLFPADPAPR